MSGDAQATTTVPAWRNVRCTTPCCSSAASGRCRSCAPWPTPGAIRYNALRSKLDGISNTVLASALRELEHDGLVTRREYLEVPVRVEYSPTDSCRALLPILEQLSDWAEARM